MQGRIESFFPQHAVTDHLCLAAQNNPMLPCGAVPNFMNAMMYPQQLMVGSMLPQQGFCNGMMTQQMVTPFSPEPTPPAGEKSTKRGRQRSRSRSRVVDLFTSSGRMRFDDDDKKVSSCYRTVGWVIGVGEKRATPKRFRASCCTACDAEEYPMVRTSQLCEEEVDCLIYVLCGVLPDTRMHDIGCYTKGEVRDALRTQYQVKNKKNPNRLQVLGSELDNLVLVAHKLGYPMRLFSPNARKYLSAMLEANITGESQKCCIADTESSPTKTAAMLSDMATSKLAIADAIAAQPSPQKIEFHNAE